MFFRLGGRRCLTELTTFDVVLLLTIAEGMQQALLGPDYSVTYGLLVGVPLLLLDLALSWWQQPYPRVGKCPTVCQWPIVDDGPPRWAQSGAAQRGRRPWRRAWLACYRGRGSPSERLSSRSKIEAMCRLYGFCATEPTTVECTPVSAQNALMVQSQRGQEGRRA